MIVVNETGSNKSTATVALMKECASWFWRVLHRRLFTYSLPLIGLLAVAVIWVIIGNLACSSSVYFRVQGLR